MDVGALAIDVGAWWSDPTHRGAIWITGIWSLTLLLVYANGRLFDRIDRRLTTTGSGTGAWPSSMSSPTRFSSSWPPWPR
jgi:hypothetical protein